MRVARFLSSEWFLTNFTRKMFGPVLDTKNSIPRCTCQKELLPVPLTRLPLHRPPGFSLLRHRTLIYKLQTFILAKKVKRLNERLFAFLRFIAIITDLRLTRPPRSVTKTAGRVIFLFRPDYFIPRVWEKVLLRTWKPIDNTSESGI